MGIFSSWMYSQIFSSVQSNKRVNAHIGSRRKICFVLVPEFRWLFSNVPFILPVTRRKIAFLGAGTFFISPGTYNDPGKWFRILFFFILIGFMVEHHSACLRHSRLPRKASVFNNLQQVNRSQLPSGKVCFSARPASLEPITMVNFISRTSRSR